MHMWYWWSCKKENEKENKRIGTVVCRICFCIAFLQMVEIQPVAFSSNNKRQGDLYGRVENVRAMGFYRMINFSYLPTCWNDDVLQQTAQHRRVNCIILMQLVHDVARYPSCAATYELLISAVVLLRWSVDGRWWNTSATMVSICSLVPGVDRSLLAWSQARSANNRHLVRV